MKIPVTTKSLGVIPYNVPVTMEYEIINDSDELLDIKNLESSCGCTTPAMSINPVPPRQTAKLILTYSANARGNNSKSASFKALGNTHHFYFSANVV